MEQKKLRQFVAQGKFFKSVVEDGSDIVLIVNYEGEILYANHSVKKTLGFNRDFLVGKNFFRFLKDEGETRKQFKASTKKPFNRSVEFQFLCKDKTFRFFEFNSINLKKSEGVEALILDCRDITQRKKDATELLMAQQAKELFMANISHEIRTPINGIAGIASLLNENTPPEEAKSYLNAIRSAAENLKVIINDILDLSRIESGQIKFEKIGFNLDDLLSALQSTFGFQAKAKGIQLNIRQETGIRKILLGDPVRLNQILINLIGNALKFTHQGSINVSVKAEEIKESRVLLAFEVKDTGIGVAKEKLNKIFERFSQADSSVTRKYGGTGLGLAIVKQLSELQQGTIDVSSIEGVGSVFTVRIPYETIDAAPIRKAEGKPASTAQAGLGKISVLLVEDNDINQLYAGSILKNWGINFEIAENGFVALEKLKTFSPDVVLMDVQMPVMDGFEATQAIRSTHPEKKQMPIIALTANATQNILEQCKACGMTDYLPKPFTPSELQQVLRLYTGKKKSSTKEESNQTNLQASGKVFDLSYLERVSGKDYNFIRQIIESFLITAEIELNNIAEAVNKRDLDNLVRSVHKMKPSLIMIGAESARELAVRIEMLGADKNNLRQVLEDTTIFQHSAERTSEALRAFLKK